MESTFWDEMSPIRSGEGMPTQLNRQRVVRAAVDYIDEYGVQNLTMRRLGSELDVEAMALYRHVAGRERLLDAVVEDLINALLDQPELSEQANSWEEYLHRVAHAIRTIVTDHPRAFPLIATQPPEAPWLRPPLRSVQWVENFLSSLKKFGFTDADAAGAYKAFTSFLLGYLLLEATARGASITGQDAEGSGATPLKQLDDYPTIKSLEALLSEDHAGREFDDALDELIERLRSSLD